MRERDLEDRLERLEGAVRAIERVQVAVTEQLDALHKEARATREAIADLNRAAAARGAAIFAGDKMTGGAGGPLQ